MNCSQVKKLLWFYAEKTLTDEKMKLVEDHLHTCADCATLASRFEKSNQILMNRREVVANPYLFTKIMQRIENNDVTHEHFSIQLAIRNIVLISVSVVAGVLLGINLLNHTTWTDTLNSSQQASVQQQENMLWYGDINEAAFDTYFETNNQVQP